jgi:Ca-activated chloride channel family protein
VTASELFARPGALPLLLLAPLLWLALELLDRARARRLAAAAGPRARALTPDLGRGRRRLRRALAAAGLAPALTPGLDLVVCLDVSRSMLARDVPPSRLLRARQELLALARRARGDRLALVAFAGEARLVVPLTQDLDSFAELAVQADPLSVRKGGTDLGAALDAALQAFPAGSRGPEAVVLVTDGEDLAGGGRRAAGRCRERGVPVHCVGFGSPLGSKIALAGDEGESYLKDRAGREVVSALDAPGLRAIAAATGGEVVDGGARPLSLVELYERHVLPRARRTTGAGPGRERQNRYQWPLLAALLLWLVELGLGDRRLA